MTEVTTLTLPDRPVAVTADLVDTWYAWLEHMAEAACEEGTYASAAEREWAQHHLMLQYCTALNTLSEVLQGRVLAKIQSHQLYRFAPESWDNLRDVIRDVLPGVTSTGYASELGHIAEVIAPFCERHGISVFDNPEKMGYVREAASYLKDMIEDPELDEVTKAARIEKEMGFIFREATSRSGTEPTSVRSRYRKIKGEPARGAYGDTALLVVGTPKTIEACKQRLSRLVKDWQPGHPIVERGQSPSRTLDGNQVVWKTTSMVLNETTIVSPITGEIVENVTQ